MDLEKKIELLKKQKDTGHNEKEESVKSTDFRLPRRVRALVPPVEDDEGWLTAYLDTMTLLLSLLIVIIAQATFNEIEGSTTGLAELEELFVNNQPDDEIAEIPAAPGVLTPLRLEALADSLQLAMESTGMEGKVALEPETRDIHLQIFGDVAFQPGSAELSPQGNEFVSHIAMLLFPTIEKLSVEGHTDNVPSAGNAYPTNWHLSSARANSVVVALTAGGIRPSRIRSIGWGHTQPLGDNNTPQGRAENRRVNITIHRFAPF